MSCSPAVTDDIQVKTMKKLSSHTVGIDSDDVVLFSDYEDGGEMWTGRGHRERRRHISFSEPYQTPPTVHMSMSLWDMDSSTIMRGEMTAEAVTETGFDMVFRTWSDTRIARLRISWTAIGSLADPDAWEI